MKIDCSLAYGERVRNAAILISLFHVGDDLRQRWQPCIIIQRTEGDIVIILIQRLALLGRTETSWKEHA